MLFVPSFIYNLITAQPDLTITKVKVDLEICNDGFDNDRDDVVDESECKKIGPLEVCNDFTDNDKDGIKDESECMKSTSFPEICDDKTDNDNDNQTDEFDCLTINATSIN